MNGIKGVTFGSIHTSKFGIYLSKVTVGSPEPKQFLINIPGADGSLDMSEYFGGVKYENRKIDLTFSMPQRGKQLLNEYSNILAALHGKYFDSIILDDDPNFHYAGRITVGNLSRSSISKITVKCDCRPYKYSNAKKTATINVTGTEFPSEWVYGDINGDGVVDQSDLDMMTALIGKRSFESEAAMRADFDFDGVITANEKNVLENYIKFPGAYDSFQAYVNAPPVSFDFKNCSRKKIDFGSAPVNAVFAVENIDHYPKWSLRIDGITQFDFSLRTSYSMILSGVREVMIVTAHAGSTGNFIVSWDNAGIL